MSDKRSIIDTIGPPTAVALIVITAGLMSWSIGWALHTLRGWEELQEQHQQEVVWDHSPYLTHPQR